MFFCQKRGYRFEGKFSAKKKLRIFAEKYLRLMPQIKGYNKSEKDNLV